MFVAGMLLRFFVNMYDQEIIEEEAFLHWKEEVNDQYPGKGKALFQASDSMKIWWNCLSIAAVFFPFLSP